MTALALDRPTVHQAAKWTAELVRLRLIEGFEIEAKLPEGKGPRWSSGSSWPAMAREFGDVVGWSDEARAEVWAQWARAKGAQPYEVTRMWEALGWLQLLAEHPGEQRCLAAWAKTKAKRRSIAKVCKLKGWDKQTFYRRLKTGSERIADELNKKAVMVR